jgi:iron complex outermembrane recepter protein
MVRVLAGVSCLALCCTAQAVMAQEAAVDENQEIVVTAGKRQQNLQDTPIAISAISGDALQDQGIVSVDDLDALTPGLVITNSPGNNNTVTVRGLGTASGASSFDQSVSLFVDGVFAGRDRDFLASLFDIERVEVIRGAQTTVLGKNTSLGAISLITRQPTFDFNGSIGAGYEAENGGAYIDAAVGGPVSERLALRFATQYVDEGGYIRNRLTGRDVGGSERFGLRASALLQFSESATATLSYQYGRYQSVGDTFQHDNDATGTANFLSLLAGDAGYESVYDDVKGTFSPLFGGDPRDSQRTNRGTLTVNLELGNHTLTAISGYSRLRHRTQFDADWLAGDYLTQTFNNRFRQFVQEVRIVSPSSDSFEYLAGLIYLDSRFTVNNPVAFNYPYGPAPGVNFTGSYVTDFTQRTESISAFAQGTLRFSPQFAVTAGLRYTDENRNGTFQRTTVVPGLVPAAIFPAFASTPLSRNSGKLDGSVNFQWTPSDDVLLYASWAQGTKSGGFANSVTLPSDAEYRDERARTLEGGLRLSLADNRVTFRGAVFRTNIRDFQSVFFSGVAFVINNFNVRSTGAEFETSIRATDWLTLGGGATYADVERAGTGATIAEAPRWTGFASGRIAFPVGTDLRASFDANLNFRSRVFHQLDLVSSPPTPAYAKLDLRAAFGEVDQGWEVAVNARNVTNRRTSGFSFPVAFVPGATASSVDPLRTITLEARFRF